jgi:hypothetical protein
MTTDPTNQQQADEEYLYKWIPFGQDPNGITFMGKGIQPIFVKKEGNQTLYKYPNPASTTRKTETDPAPAKVEGSDHEEVFICQDCGQTVEESGYLDLVAQQIYDWVESELIGKDDQLTRQETEDFGMNTTPNNELRQSQRAKLKEKRSGNE